MIFTAGSDKNGQDEDEQSLWDTLSREHQRDRYMVDEGQTDWKYLVDSSHKP